MLKTFLEKVFLSTEFRKNATFLSVGNVILLVMQTAFYPVAARLYPNDSFGEFAIVQSITYVVGFCMTLKFEAAILSSSSNEEALKVKQSVRLWSLSLFIFFVIGSFLVPSSYVDAFLSVEYLMMVPFFLLSFGMNQLYRHWYLRLNKVEQFMKYLFIQKSSSIIFTFLLAYVLTSFNGIIVGHVLGAVVFIGLILRKEKDWTSPDWRLLRKTFGDHIRFLKFLMPSNLIQMSGTHAPLLLSNQWFGKGMTGELSMALQVIHLPQTVLFGKLSESLHQRFNGVNVDHGELRTYLFKLWRHMFMLMFVPSLLLFFWGEPIFTFILGDQWLLSGQMAALLAVPMFTAAFVGVGNNVFIALNKQHVLLRLQLLRLFIVIVAFGYGVIYTDLLLAVSVFSMVIALFHVFSCWILVRLLSAT